MDSRYFNVDEIYDRETGEEKYEIFSKTALANEVYSYDANFSYHSPDELWDISSLDDTKVLKEKIEEFRKNFVFEIEKLTPVFEDENFDSDDIDERWDDLKVLVENNIDLFSKAEDFDVDFGDFDASEIDDINELAENLATNKDAVIENLGSMIENFNEKIEATEDFHEFTRETLISLGLDNAGMLIEDVIEELVNGKDFSEIYSEWEDRQYDYMEPIYNYIYPLDTVPSDKQAVAVARDTNCVVILVDDEPYLALTGAGMDMSQDIAYAKGVICNNWLSHSDCMSVMTEKPFSIGKEKYMELMSCLKESLENIVDSANRKLKQINEVLPKDTSDIAESHLDKLVKKLDEKDKLVDEAEKDVDSNESKKVRRDR